MPSTVKYTGLCSILLILPLMLLAQPNKFGVPLITNYPYHITTGDEQNWCITQDHRGVVYVGNHNKGILEYDGVEWRNIPVPNDLPVRSLVTGEDGMVYAGLEGDFGKLEPDALGLLHFRSLYDSVQRADFPGVNIFKTYSDQEKIYFCASEAVFIYDIPSAQVTTIKYSGNVEYSFLVNHRLYALDWGKGLMVYDGQALQKLPGGDFFREKMVSGLESIDENHLLVSTYYEGLNLLNTRTGNVSNTFVSSELNELFREALISYLTIMNGKILVGTQDNGLYILDTEGNVLEIISEREGLIDNVITQVYSDPGLKGSGPLWIAHWKGVSKVETNNPFRRLTESSGFRNLVTKVTYFEGEFFVSTMTGLFKYNMDSNASGISFSAVPGIEATIYDMKVVEPVRGRRFLLVSSDQNIHVINERMHLSTVQDRMFEPPASAEDLEQISGRQICLDPKNKDIIYVGYNHVIGLKYSRGQWKEFYRFRDNDDMLYSLVKDKYGYLWATTDVDVKRLDVTSLKEATLKIYSKENGLPFDEDNYAFLNPENEEILMGTDDGFYRFDYFHEVFQRDTFFNAILPEGRNSIWTMYQDKDGDYWLSFENETQGWTEILARKVKDRLLVVSQSPFQRLPNASVDMFRDDQANGVWLSKADELYHFDKEFSRNDSLPFQTLIRKVTIHADSILHWGTNYRLNSRGVYDIHPFQEESAQPEIKYRYNTIGFHWAAPYFEQEERLLYSHRLAGFSDEWSEWSPTPSREFTNLKHGYYTLFVKARNVYGFESEAASYAFSVSRPWYASIPAIIAYFILSGLLVYLIIKLYTRRLKNENIRLEGIIQERTAKIREQKEELTDSIQYASRIQRALLPSRQLMEDHKVEHFILFRPRDIVSGDFYWMGLKKGKLVIVAADCTGHGVPGAFMSMLGITFLDEIVIKSDITATGEILDSLREHVVHSLVESGGDSRDTVRDGMDLAMVSLDMKHRKIQYSGAYNPLYLVRKLKPAEKKKIGNGEELDLPRGSIYDEEHLLIQIRADQMPIGLSEKNAPFTSTTLKDEGYNIYMFSDGFQDQFGGPRRKKFMSRNFKKRLLELQSIPLPEQGEALEETLLDWMGELSQIDDILVIGLRLNHQ